MLAFCSIIFLKGLPLHLYYELYFLSLMDDLAAIDSVKCLELKLAKCVFEKLDKEFFYSLSFFLTLVVGILCFLKLGMDYYASRHSYILHLLRLVFFSEGLALEVLKA